MVDLALASGNCCLQRKSLLALVRIADQLERGNDLLRELAEVVKEWYEGIYLLEGILFPEIDVLVERLLGEC
jgi:hypothetical protein